jgi:hypothetical protein
MDEDTITRIYCNVDDFCAALEGPIACQGTTKGRILFLGEKQYREARERAGRRDNFYAALRYTFSRFLHEDTGRLLSCSSGGMNPMDDTLNS